MQQGHEQKVTMASNARISRRSTAQSQATDERRLYLRSYELLLHMCWHIFHTDNEPEPRLFDDSVSPAQQYTVEHALAECGNAIDARANSYRRTIES